MQKKEKLWGGKLRRFWRGVALCQESLGSWEGRQQEPILLQPPAPRFSARSQICMQKALPSSTKPHNSQQEHTTAPQFTADTPTDETSRSEEQGGREKRRERNKPGQRQSLKARICTGKVFSRLRYCGECCKGLEVIYAAKMALRIKI